MTCTVINNRNFKGFICSRASSSKRCVECNGRASLLCDYPLSGEKTGQTCDRNLCGRCTHKHEGKDFCYAHSKLKESGK